MRRSKLTPMRVAGFNGQFAASLSLATLVATGILSTAVTTAQADTSPGAPAPSGNEAGATLAEIVVTAQKREERLQDVPVAVSVVDADTMLQNHEIYLRDYVATVPGLSLTEAGNGLSQITIRGLSSDTNPTVGVTIDDVPVGSTVTADTYGSPVFTPQLDPSDLQRVEVLKGPQGTLYGANSIGGILRYVTAPPDLTSTFGRAQIDGSTIPNGGGSGYGVRGAANIPVIADTFGIRVSVFHREDPGFIDDPAHNPKNFNTANATGGRLDSLWQVTPDLSVRLAALVDRTEGTTGYVDTVYSASGPLAYRPIYGDLTHVALPGTGGYKFEHQLYSGTVKFHTGSFDVTSITALSRQLSDFYIDYTPVFGGYVPGLFPNFSCPCGASDPVLIHVSKFTQELRLASPSGAKIEWLVGAFYTDENLPAAWFDLRANDLQTGAPIPSGELFVASFDTRYHEYAGFGDLTYHFTNQFDVQVGARESHNWQSYYQSSALGALGGPAVGENSRDSSFTYLVTPRLRLSDTFTAYARIASGYLAGGPNTPVPGATAPPPPYGPAKSVNYELGIKTSFLGRRATVNADIFDVEWSKIQLTKTDFATQTSYLYNGGNARSRGFETEAKLLPLDSLTLSATVAYTDAILTQSVPGYPGTAGNWLPYGSRWSGSLSADQRFQLSAVATGFVGATWAHVGQRYGDYNQLNPGGGQRLWPGYHYANARVGVQAGGYTVTAFVNNLSNTRGVLNASPQNPSLVLTSVTTPRTVGLSLTKEFK